MSPFPDDIQFETAGRRFMANKNWMEDLRSPLPIGTLMGSFETTATFYACNSAFQEMAGQWLHMVYEPPANGTPWGTGYRIPTTNPAVVMDLEFPGGMSYPEQKGSIMLSSSNVPVSNLGVVSGFQNFPVRLTMVKVGNFSNANIKVDGPRDMGVFKYYGMQNGKLANFRQRLGMPLHYGMGSTIPGAYVGQAYTPFCNFILGGTYDFSVVKLTPVNTNAFKGIGPADHPARAEGFGFFCRGSRTTQPEIYFEATHPLGDGSNGVGMETPTSDVGVQLLFNDVPIRLGPAFALHVPTTMTPVPDLNMGAGVWASPDGFFCLPTSNCKADMTTNWFKTEAAWERWPITAPVTLKYYQTTANRPKPGPLSVPFTITVNVQ